MPSALAPRLIVLFALSFIRVSLVITWVNSLFLVVEHVRVLWSFQAERSALAARKKQLSANPEQAVDKIRRTRWATRRSACLCLLCMHDLFILLLYFLLDSENISRLVYILRLALVIGIMLLAFWWVSCFRSFLFFFFIDLFRCCYLQLRFFVAAGRPGPRNQELQPRHHAHSVLDYCLCGSVCQWNVMCSVVLECQRKLGEKDFWLNKNNNSKK